MLTAEILHHFERVSGKFPRAAVEAAVARRDEITPLLLHILEDTVVRAEELADEDDYMAHLYAMFLLAQFRETQAYPLVVRFALLPRDLPDSLSGDFVTHDLGRVLASVCGGDLQGIQSIIENEDANQWARGAAIDALVTLVFVGQKSREEIITYFTHLFRGGLAREWSNVWDGLVSAACDLYPEELLSDIEQAYKEDLIDTRAVGLEDVQRDLALGKEQVLDRFARNRFMGLIEDTEKEIGGWVCFREKPAKTAPPTPAPAPPPVPATVTKTGRNDPCPCGSGKKYKKCCLT